MSPWKTIDSAEEKVKAGDMIVVGSGVYDTPSVEYAQTTLYIQNTGRLGFPITIRSERKWGAVIEGGSHSAVWFDCDAVPTPSYIKIEGFEIRNTAIGVFSKDNNGEPYNTRCSNLEITNLKIHNVGIAGVDLEAAENSIVGNNEIFDINEINSNHNLNHGIYLSDNTEGILVKNNLIYDCKEGWPIHIYDQHNRGGPARNHKIINNTLINDNPYRTGGIVMFGYEHIVRNNLIYNRAVPAPNYIGAIADQRNRSHTGTIVENNITNLSDLCARDCPDADKGANIVSANLSREFLNTAADNYRLNAGAISLDKGTSAGAPLDDLDGFLRNIGAIDVGAFEKR